MGDLLPENEIRVRDYLAPGLSGKISMLYVGIQ